MLSPIYSGVFAPKSNGLRNDGELAKENSLYFARLFEVCKGHWVVVGNLFNGVFRGNPLRNIWKEEPYVPFNNIMKLYFYNEFP